MTKKTTADTAEPPTFVLSAVEREPDYVWRELDREGKPPIRVKVRDLSIAQTNQIPIDAKTKLSEAFKIIAPWVVEWDFTAFDTNSGQTVPVPPPAEYGWEVLELLDAAEAGDLISWLKWPHQMKGMQEKKRSATSTTTPTPPKRNG